MSTSWKYTHLPVRATVVALFGAAILVSIDRGSPLGEFVLRQAAAQVVQLPTVRNFSYSGGASVPDHGDAYMGGSALRRSSSTSSGAGPLANRSTSSQGGGSSLSVSATIIDLQAMDEAILKQPIDAPPRATTNYAPRSTGTPVMNTLTPYLYGQRAGRASTAANDPNAWQMALSAPVATRESGSRVARDDSEVRFYMLKTQQATASGRNAAARVYYQMAYDRLTPEQRTRLQEIQRRANELAQQASAEAGSSDASASGVTAGTGNRAATSAAGDTPAGNDASRDAPVDAGDFGFPAEGSTTGSSSQPTAEAADPFASPF